LGNGSTYNVGTTSASMGSGLIAVPLRKPAVSLAIDTGHSCAMLNDGGMQCWGYNNWGQLGLGTQTTEGSSAGQISALSEINFGTGDKAAAISIGGGFSSVLDINGNVKSWGHNFQGNLGVLWCAGNSSGYGPCSNSAYPVSLDGYGNNQGQMGDALPAINIGTGVTASALVSGDTFSCVVTQGTEEVLCWGYNNLGQLGSGSTNSVGTSPSQMGAALTPVSITAPPATGPGSIAAGESHVCILTTGNVVECWGDNSYGQLGIPKTTQQVGTKSGYKIIAATYE
jgi:alpha-tubulin suppressor-like RCC1 family protein